MEGNNNLLVWDAGDLGLLSAELLDVVAKRLIRLLLDLGEVKVISRSVAGSLETFNKLLVEVSPRGE